jgi:hypothetical protein
MSNHLARQRRALVLFGIFVESASCRSSSYSGLSNGLGHGEGYALVEDAWDHVVLNQALLRYDLRYGPRRSQLHLLGDLVRPRVQSTPEDAREAQEVFAKVVDRP